MDDRRPADPRSRLILASEVRDECCCWLSRRRRFSRTVACYGCGSGAARPFIEAQDDLTGKPGTLPVRHAATAAAWPTRIRACRSSTSRTIYDDEYIAHRKTQLGAAEQGVRAGHEPARRREGRPGLALRRVSIAPAKSSTSGCGVGTFLRRLQRRYGARRPASTSRTSPPTPRSAARSFIAASSTTRRSRTAGSTS